MGSASAPREVPNQLFSRGCAHTAARRAAARRAAVRRAVARRAAARRAAVRRAAARRAAVRRAAVDLLDAWLRHHSKST